MSYIKAQAYKLRANYQIPYQLSKFIYDLTIEDKESYIKFLTLLTEQCLRVKGFYKRYPLEEERINEELKKRVVKFKEDINASA